MNILICFFWFSSKLLSQMIIPFKNIGLCFGAVVSFFWHWRNSEKKTQLLPLCLRWLFLNGMCIMQIFFVNKIFIISEDTVFGCVLKCRNIAHKLVYVQSLRFVFTLKIWLWDRPELIFILTPLFQGLSLLWYTTPIIAVKVVNAPQAKGAWAGKCLAKGT